jgi:hypothetical protein
MRQTFMRPLPSISLPIHATSRTLLKGSCRLFLAEHKVNQLDFRGSWRRLAKAKKMGLTHILHIPSRIGTQTTGRASKSNL